LLIGLTYDLRADYLAEGLSLEETAEFDRPDTIEAIEGAIRRLGHRTVRIGRLKALVKHLAKGERWDLVFNICEGRGGYGREAQVPAVLEGHGIPCTLSDSLTMALTLHKGHTKRVIRDLGVPTPDFAVVEGVAGIAGIDLPFPLFCKPVAEGTGLGVSAKSKVRDRTQLAKVCKALLKRHRQPVLVETYLPGREFTVGIIGEGARARAVGTCEVVLKDAADPAYGYANKENCEELVLYRLVDDAEAREAARVALAAYRGLGCRDTARVDLRSDAKGRPSFMEINPLPGLHPEHSDLPILCAQAGMSYDRLIGAILAGAARRVGKATGRRRRR